MTKNITSAIRTLHVTENMVESIEKMHSQGLQSLDAFETLKKAIELEVINSFICFLEWTNK